MQKERRFKVKFGYKTDEYISIPLEKLAKAIYSKQTGSLFSYNDKFIDGKEIKSITPHWHVHTGWYEYYDPKEGEDFAQIERDCPKYDGLIDQATDLAFEAVRTGNKKLLDTQIKLLN